MKSIKNVIRSVAFLGCVVVPEVRSENLYSRELEIPFGRSVSSLSISRPSRPRLEGVITTTPPLGEAPRIATLRFGPFYSNVDLSQSIGYRYSRRSGVGTDLLYDYNRGEISKDGSELPIYTTLTMDNHAVLTRYADAHLTINAENLYFPLGTQENDLNVNIGAGAGAGADAAARVGFLIGEDVYGSVFDNLSYRVDYRDSRGLEDRYGGEKYARIQNALGGQVVWDMDKEQFMRLDLAREDEWPMTDRFDDQEATIYSEQGFYGNKINAYLTMGAGAHLSQTVYTADERGTAYRQSTYVQADARLTKYSVTSAQLGYSWSGLSSASGFYGDEEDDGTVIGSLSLGTRLSKSVSHWFDIGRSQVSGFVSAAEIRDTLRYEVIWIDDLAPGSAYTEYSSVEPGNPSVTSYSDWTSGVDVSYRLNSRLTLDAMTSYSLRTNSGQLGKVPSEHRDYYDELLETTDYSTWVSRVGTSVSIHPKADFRVYYKHVERWSGDETMDYVLDIFEAVVTFRHRF
jgi:hypothetical protein